MSRIPGKEGEREEAVTPGSWNSKVRAWGSEQVRSSNRLLNTKLGTRHGYFGGFMPWNCRLLFRN